MASKSLGVMQSRERTPIIEMQIRQLDCSRDSTRSNQPSATCMGLLRLPSFTRIGGFPIQWSHTWRRRLRLSTKWRPSWWPVISSRLTERASGTVSIASIKWSIPSAIRCQTTLMCANRVTAFWTRLMLSRPTRLGSRMQLSSYILSMSTLPSVICAHISIDWRLITI